jgi:uncharacterized protein
MNKSKHGTPSGVPAGPVGLAGPRGSAITGEASALSRASSQMQDLSWLITDFTERAPDALHAAVVSSDGVPVAVSDGLPPDRVEQLSAITSGLISMARGAALMFDGGAVTQTLVTMREGVLVIVAISNGSSLAVLAAIDADLDQIAYEMTVLAEQAGSALTPDARRPPRAAGGRA